MILRKALGHNMSNREQIYEQRYDNDCHFWADSVEHLRKAIDSLESGGWSGEYHRALLKALDVADRGQK